MLLCLQIFMDTSDKWTLSWRNGTELHSRQITKYMKEKEFCYWKFVFLQKSKICQRSLAFLPTEPQSKFSIVVTNTAQKMKFSIKDFFSKCDQIHRQCVCLSRRTCNWHCSFVVIITEQCHSAWTELQFCSGSNPARGVLNVCDDEYL